MRERQAAERRKADVHDAARPGTGSQRLRVGTERPGCPARPRLFSLVLLALPDEVTRPL